MGFVSFDVQDNIMIMEDKDVKDSSSDSSSSMDSGEEEEEVNSSLSSSSTSSLSHSNSPPSDHPTAAGDDPLNDMSSLLQQLPFKRGLSKYYEGKSKSFTCLSNVRSLEDLAKPENPYNKKLKSCKSRSNLHKSASSKLISKKTSRASCSSLITKRINMINKPPTHPPSRSNSTTHFSNQTPIQIQTQTQNQTPLFV